MGKRSTPDEYTRDLRQTFVSPSPRFQSKRRFSAAQASGSITLAAYRGEHNGVFKAYKAIRKQFPEAARVLLNHFNMNTRGDIVLT